MKKKTVAVLSTTVLAVGVALAGASSASAYTDYYGYAACAPYGNHPTTQSYGVGNVTHEIGSAAGGEGSYYYQQYANGSVRQIRTMKSKDSSAPWATFLYSDYWTQTSWYCG